MMLAELEFKKSREVMTIEKLINELKNHGYDIYLDGENIRYRFHALAEPPKERVAVLLDSLKKNKPEVISYLRATEKPNKPLSPHETGLDIQKMPLSKFVKAGKVLKVWSEVLKEHVYFVSSEEAISRCTDASLVAYTAQELQAMLEMAPEEVKAAQEVKRLFHKARVIEHRKAVNG